MRVLQESAPLPVSPSSSDRICASMMEPASRG